MGTFSPAHWFIVLLMITPLMALLVVPTWRILHRAGFNGAWALLMLVPVVGLLVPWAIAFLKWPTDREARTTTSSAGLVVGVVLLPLALVTLGMVVNATVGQVLGPMTSVVEIPALQSPPAVAPQFGQQVPAPAVTAGPAFAPPIPGQQAPGGFDPSSARKVD
ncbi:hypothetical protein LJR066_005704 [Acidovorax sp. LjRoot66]|uniref:hypothetical protein n=1 Tax=Acidovorax sp. LjRoot66 TaxID=3342334 RepID=UPI003ECD4E29